MNVLKKTKVGIISTQTTNKMFTCMHEMHMVKRLALAQLLPIFDIIQMIQHLLKLYQNPLFQKLEFKRTNKRTSETLLEMPFRNCTTNHKQIRIDFK